MSIPSRFIHPRPPFNKNPVYHQQPPASPVHLSGSLVLRSGTNGAVPQAALKNPMGQDMELLEIKFELFGVNQTPGFAGTSQYGGAVWCELTMGKIKLTNGSIPVWNFGRSENHAGEFKTDNAFDLLYMAYSWRLPRPLFIPAGAVVVPNFTHTGFISDTINVRVGYSGRTVFVKPKKVYVPWVAKYASKVFNPISAAGVDNSTELDLVNPHPEVLHLQRFVGRTMSRLSTGPQAGATSETAPESFGSKFLSVRVTDSYGRPIVRSYTPFRDVFGALTRSWEMDNGAELDPQSFYRVALKKDAAALVPNSQNDVAQAFISMVGWREMSGEDLSSNAEAESDGQ